MMCVVTQLPLFSSTQKTSHPFAKLIQISFGWRGFALLSDSTRKTSRQVQINPKKFNLMTGKNQVF